MAKKSKKVSKRGRGGPRKYLTECGVKNVRLELKTWNKLKRAFPEAKSWPARIQAAAEYATG